jgi:exoribonuclease R
MIEEFMLAANISVAEKILKHFPLCSLLRYLPSINIQFVLAIYELNTS